MKCEICETDGFLHNGLCAGCDGIKKDREKKATILNQAILSIIKSGNYNTDGIKSLLTDLANTHTDVFLAWIKENVRGIKVIDGTEVEWL